MISRILVSSQVSCVKKTLNCFNGLRSSFRRGYVNAQIIGEYTLEMSHDEFVGCQTEQRL